MPKITLYTSRSTKELHDRHAMLRRNRGTPGSIWGKLGDLPAGGSSACSVSLDVNPEAGAIT